MVPPLQLALHAAQLPHAETAELHISHKLHISCKLHISYNSSPTQKLPSACACVRECVHVNLRVRPDMCMDMCDDVYEHVHRHPPPLPLSTRTYTHPPPSHTHTKEKLKVHMAWGSSRT